MSNNRTFFKNAQAGQMSLKDIFSETLKKHTPEEKARVLIAGTPLTTPTEAEMLSGWQKPFLFARFFLVTAIVSGLGYIMFDVFEHVGGLFVMLVAMSLLVTVSLLLLVWEMNIPRNISLYEVLGIFSVGGILSLIATLFLLKFDTSTGAQWAPLTEEPAKLLIVYLVLMKKDRKYTLNGMLIGMAVGAGFAAMETLSYIFYYAFQEGLSYGLKVAITRALVAINGHGLWAALYGGALVMVKGREKLSPSHLLKPPFLFYFGAAFALHYLHNSEIGSSLGMMKYAVLSVAALVVFLSLLRKGVNEIVEITANLNGGRVTRAVERDMHIAAENPAPVAHRSAARLEFISGAYAGKTLPLESNRSFTLGRVKGKCDVPLPECGSISALHCAVAYANGVLTVTDLGSTNGTRVDGRQLAPNRPTTVGDGSEVTLGGSQCAFRVHL